MEYLMLVNKENPLSADFVPDNLVFYPEYNGEKIDPNYKTYVVKDVLDAFFEMQAAAKEEGLHIIIDSAYRSYQYQEMVLAHTIEEIGEKAYKLVALPGTSEHQSGLAIDVALMIDGQYTDEFDDTYPQIKWLFEHAYEYGFILRYPKGYEDITGFNYECWHYRFVGKEASLEMHEKNIATLENYLSLKR